MTLRIFFPFLFLLVTSPVVLGQTSRAVTASSLKSSPEVSQNSSTHTVPAGTVLYLRLKTPVSTTTSNLGQEVDAEVERSVRGPEGIEIPVGAEVRGKIAKLIPSSSPTDRAKLLLRFTSLKVPGQPAIPLAGHVTGVDNARESVLPDGTIVGVLASELPVTLLNSAIQKLEKSSSSGTQQAQTGGGTGMGTADTSITYPVGTEFFLALDKPLTVQGTFQPEFAGQLPGTLKETILQLLAHSPKRVANKKGNLGGAVNLVLIGNAQEIRTAFEKAGWTPAEEETGRPLWKTFQAVIAGKGYDAAPMSTLYVYGRPQDMAFEKMLNTFAMRHHLRLWKAPVKSPQGRDVWLVSADHDNGIDIHPGVISHATDPDVDAEREKVGADLGMTGLVAAEELVTPPNPLHSGYTATGGKWETDGRVLVIDLKS
ncbi:MAG: LssY C-terminal domain-containing protein [Acidobacteria bacterium]|nr:LssY C-terminal domain-containing protein [Acidobacteriota bacterium]